MTDTCPHCGAPMKVRRVKTRRVQVRNVHMHDTVKDDDKWRLVTGWSFNVMGDQVTLMLDNTIVRRHRANSYVVRQSRKEELA